MQLTEMLAPERVRVPLAGQSKDELLRELGQTLTLAVEATCRNFDAGETEADVAGHLAHRLLREGVVPADLRVAGDDRLARFRQPSFKAAPIRKHATRRCWRSSMRLPEGCSYERNPV